MFLNYQNQSTLTFGSPSVYEGTVERQIPLESVGATSISRPSEFPSVVITSTTSLKEEIRATIASTTILAFGFFDLAIYILKGTYLFHPYFALIISVAGIFLLASVLIAVKSK
jgi:hypothetical protein